jgi:hypothetical protein
VPDIESDSFYLHLLLLCSKESDPSKFKLYVKSELKFQRFQQLLNPDGTVALPGFRLAP